MVFVLERYSTLDRIFISGGESVKVRSNFLLNMRLVCVQQPDRIIMFFSLLSLRINEYKALANRPFL